MNGLTFYAKEQKRLIDQYPEGDIPGWEQEAFDQIKAVMDAVKVIVDYGNVMGRKSEQTAEIIFDVLEQSHRTLQQTTISALIQTLVNYAENAQADGRNEYSVKACKAIRQGLHDEGFLQGAKGDIYRAPFI